MLPAVRSLPTATHDAVTATHTHTHTAAHTPAAAWCMRSVSPRCRRSACPAGPAAGWAGAPPAPHPEGCPAGCAAAGGGKGARKRDGGISHPHQRAVGTAPRRGRHHHHHRHRLRSSSACLPPEPSQQELALEGVGHLQVLAQQRHKPRHAELLALRHNVLQRAGRGWRRWWRWWRWWQQWWWSVCVCVCVMHASRGVG